MKRNIRPGGQALAVLAVSTLSASAFASSITSLSIPVNSMDASCRPLDENVWSVSPLNVNSGIGYLVNPSSPDTPPNTGFVLHDHRYVASHVPDPARAVVTYGFDLPSIVSSIEIIEHTNGISEIEGFVGNSLGSMASIGTVTGSAGPGPYVELQSNVFTFTTPAAGLYFQFVVRKTSLANGYAAYRAFPEFTEGAVVPLPAAAWMGLSLLGGVGACGYVRRQRAAD